MILSILAFLFLAAAANQAPAPPPAPPQTAPAKAKPADARPGDVKPGDVKPAAAKPADTKPVPPAAPAATPAAETLRYSLNWPTGLSLGEATLSTAQRTTPEGKRIETTFHLDASVPGFPIVEDHRSLADGDYCSAEFDKRYTRGKRKAEETTKFDQAARQAVRETKGGGKSDLSTPACAKDALSYIGFIRRELAAGRLPPSQPVYFGAAYQLRVEFKGTQTIRLAEAPVQADLILATLKGPSSDLTFEAFFEKNPARTPVLVRVPLALATFSLELVRQ